MDGWERSSLKDRSPGRIKIDEKLDTFLVKSIWIARSVSPATLRAGHTEIKKLRGCDWSLAIRIFANAVCATIWVLVFRALRAPI